MNIIIKKRKVISLALVLGLFLIISGCFHTVKTIQNIENQPVGVVVNVDNTENSNTDIVDNIEDPNTDIMNNDHINDDSGNIVIHVPEKKM